MARLPVQKRQINDLEGDKSMSQDAKSFLRERGWNWYIKSEEEHPAPRPTHWKYGASVLMIPRITVYHE